ncbi:pyridoxamine 5'-phosphate oxidase family protein [Dyadobacter sp. CY356]|uniref:pyridoxamine 5'-phosphate oxidase family protein n=1 Tax=Dyadobacter sp. CY356 TaxID=2906442 RepID=UPI001F4863A7|nr:pyridoxamine 5'-phosphate oxidase family protein [Dyadobacter sp. CY356]MCF0058803.1 pyridoxamine 5'-phosphate oxidase family protein [Dyadobacter sp. CY356]
MPGSVFHNGELYVQQSTGEEYFAMQNGSIVRDSIMGGALNFVHSQRFFFASTKDQDGRLWASVLSGNPGFLDIQDAHNLLLNIDFLNSSPGDIFWENIRNNSSIGLLFIELATRRRFRVNGNIIQLGKLWKIEIEQAYPNCPKYIQRREFTETNLIAEPASRDIKKWIAEADTIFVASAGNDNNLDMSHRGGNPGFISWAAENVLRIPDYRGNSMFNTLGNFYENPQAGLLFVNFENGETMKLSGKAELFLNDEKAGSFTGGTNRYWDFHIEKIIFEKSLENFSMHLVDYSRYNP